MGSKFGNWVSQWEISAWKIGHPVDVWHQREHSQASASFEHPAWIARLFRNAILPELASTRNAWSDHNVFLLVKQHLAHGTKLFLYSLFQPSVNKLHVSGHVGTHVCYKLDSSKTEDLANYRVWILPCFGLENKCRQKLQRCLEVWVTRRYKRYKRVIWPIFFSLGCQAQISVGSCVIGFTEFSPSHVTISSNLVNNSSNRGFRLFNATPCWSLLSN